MRLTYRLCHLAASLVAKLLFRHRVLHAERAKYSGPLLVVANHASYFDPPLVSISISTPIHFLARSTLYSNPVARWLFPRLNVVPVDQDKPEVGSLKAVMRILKAGEQVLIFPEGQRSFDGNLQPAEAGAGFIAAKTRAAVLPMRIFGAHEALPPGEKKIKLRRITVVIGNILHFTDEECNAGKGAYQELSDRMMQAIASLECPPELLPKPR